MFASDERPTSSLPAQGFPEPAARAADALREAWQVGLTLTSGDVVTLAALQFARTLDALGQALLLCDTSGREVHRTRRLEEIISADPEGALVLGEMWRVAKSLLQLRVPRFDARPQPAGTIEIATRTARYEIRGGYFESGTLGPGDAVLVSLERLTPQLPSAERLMKRFGLTRREADVASLLAFGLSNREIAERLSASLHTVRHHAEGVFTKLGIHSRKALALRLIEQRH